MTIPTLFQKIHKIISQIPKGKVATYGHIAVLAGNPRAARTVGWVLNSSKSDELPWHRVINAQGRSSFPDRNKRMLQQSMLEAEGIIFNNEKVDLDIFLWNGNNLHLS